MTPRHHRMTVNPTGPDNTHFCSCGKAHGLDWDGWAPTRAPDYAGSPERTDGWGSGYVRGDRFWTRVTMSHGREVR
jgi:hypothetical protein